MVAKDAMVRPARLEIEMAFERRLFEAGKMRREMRQEIMERNRSLHSGIPG